MSGQRSGETSCSTSYSACKTSTSWGDLTKSQYIMHRQALEEELQRQGPTKPASDRARALRDDLASGTLRPSPRSDGKLLLSLFEQLWAQNGRIVAVQPQDDFLPYFQAIQQGAAPGGAESGSDGGRTLSGHRIGLRL
jgi:hypothetical protein